MIKYWALFSIYFLPILSSAQSIHTLTKEVSPNAHFIAVKDKTILVEPIDAASESQKWTTLDSALQIISIKRMVTPGANLLISQAFLPGFNKVLRIDQMLVEDELKIGAFVFDTEGNLLNVKAIDAVPAPGTKIIHSPFMLTQSPDKRSIALVQAQQLLSDSLAIAAIVLDDALNVISNTGYRILYEPMLSELKPPMLSNDQNLFVTIADKFDSYKLSASVNFHVLAKGSTKHQTFVLPFDRKKIKYLNLATQEEQLNFSAFYSNSNDKENINGLVYTSFDWRRNQRATDAYYAITQQAVKELKKMFAIEGRKGKLLNYLAPLPVGSANAHQSFAVLLPENPDPVRAGPKPVPPPVTGLGAIRQNLENVNQLVGSTPRGTTKPLTVAEANTYAATMQQGVPNNIPNTDDIYKNPHSQNNKPQNQKEFKKNLLYFSNNNGQAISQFVKLRPIQDEAYSFFTYIPEKNGYSALHYLWPSLKRASLTKTTIDKDGKVTSKNVFEDQSKILLGSHPFIATEKKLIAFYQDKFTGEMGILQIPLQQ